ncbi:MAG TPA: DUF4129 domain-containing protein [Galbitalea sp.]|jgi:hypothetical protein|nr:DUF4129 domain-containing protein [Galbitalea sp.]
MSAPRLPLDPPVTPNGPTAQNWLLQELSKSDYTASHPNWFDEVATAISNWFQSLTGPSVPGIPGLGPLILVVAIVVVAVIAFLIFGLPRLNRRSRVGGELFGEADQRTAAKILADARAAASDENYSLAIIEGVRASARTLSERTLFTMFPGTTAHEFARRAAVLFPAERDSLVGTATAFDRVRYLDEQGSRDQWLDVERLATTLRTAEPVLATVDA